MTNNIISTKTSIPGVDLIYLEDLDVAGIHYSGLARLLGCDAKTIANVAEGLNLDETIEAEIHTSGGFQGVKFVLESGVVKVLKTIRRSTRIKKETREAAEDLYDRLAVAGFKLYAMLQVAPEALKAKVDKHVEEMEILKLRHDVLKLEKELLDKKDWIVRSMPEVAQQKILGYERVVEIEYRDRVLYNEDVIRDGTTISKTEICRRLGLVTKSGSPDYRKLNKIIDSCKLPSKAWRLTAAIKENEELDASYWPVLEQRWLNGERNLLLGE